MRSLVVKSTSFVLPALGLALVISAGAQSPAKVGVINIQSAIVSTKDGQKAANEIQTRFNPKKTELDKRQSDIGQLQDQLNRGRNTLSEDARNKLVRDIDQKTKSLTRDTEDARAELDQDEQKIMNELGGRIMAVIDKYAKDNGYTLILDVSSPQTPVLYASNTIDITKDIIDLYDRNAPGAASGTGTPAGTSVARPAITRPAPAAPKPAPNAPPK
jgi:outer membrane protein